MVLAEVVMAGCHLFLETFHNLRFISAVTTPLLYISFVIGFLIKQTVGSGLKTVNFEWISCSYPDNTTYCLEGECYMKKSDEFAGYEGPKCRCEPYFTGQRCELFFLPAGLMAGVIFLAIVLVAAIAIGISFCLYKRLQNNKNDGRNTSEEAPMTSNSTATRHAEYKHPPSKQTEV